MKPYIAIILTPAQAKFALEAIRNIPETHLGKPQLYSKRGAIDEIEFALNANEKRKQ